MKNDPRLSNRQKKFLRAYRSGEGTIEQLDKKLNQKRWLLNKWLDQPYFRRVLARIQSGWNHRGVLEFKCSVVQATTVMSKVLAGEEVKPPVQSAAVVVLKLDLARHRLPKSPKPPVFKRTHPDVPADEAQDLHRQLSASRAAA